MSEWYYMYGGQQQGPVTAAQLKSLAATGSLGPDDLVWNSSMTEWAAAKRMRGLNFVGQAAMVPQSVAVPGLAASFGHEAAPQAYAPAPAYEPTSEAPLATATAPQQLGYSAGRDDGVSPRTLELLRQTRPWVLLVSVVMFIGTGLLLLGVIIGIIATVAGGAGLGRIFGAGGAAAGAVVGIVMIVVFLIYAALLFFPALFSDALRLRN